MPRSCESGWTPVSDGISNMTLPPCLSLQAGTSSNNKESTNWRVEEQSQEAAARQTRTILCCMPHNQKWTSLTCLGFGLEAAQMLYSKYTLHAANKAWHETQHLYATSTKFLDSFWADLMHDN